MKVKYIIPLAALLLVVSCSNRKVIEVAETYTTEYICPMFENAELSDYMKVKKHRLEKIHRPIISLKGLRSPSNSIPGILPHDARIEKLMCRVMPNSGQTKSDKIIQALQQAAIETIAQDTLHQALYIAWVSVDYGGSMPAVFDIILSKDMEVMNLPVSLDLIEESVLFKDEKSEDTDSLLDALNL